MFERYTERARRVLFFARYEASQLRSVSIETEHVLLGLIREGNGLTSRILARYHLSLVELRQAIELRAGLHKISTSVEIPFSPETKRILQAAAEEADRLLHNYIGTEHLLLGLLHEERSVGGAMLIERGLRLDGVREEIVRLLSEKAASEEQRSVRIVVGPKPKEPRRETVCLVIVMAQANDVVSLRLLAGAQDALREAGVADRDVTVVPVPGVSDIPIAVQCAGATGRFDAAICLGSLVRATMPHADIIFSAVAHGLQFGSSRTSVPSTLGLLTTDSVEEATVAATGKGYDAAKAALEMVTVVRTLRDVESSGP